MDNSYDVPRTPRRRHGADRFVPHREGVKLDAAYSAMASARSPERRRMASPSDPTDVKAQEAQEARAVYENVLKLEMFGGDLALRATPEPAPSNSPSRSSSVSSLASNASSTNQSVTASAPYSPPRRLSRGGGLSPAHSFGSLRSVASSSSLSLPPSPRKQPPAGSGGLGAGGLGGNGLGVGAGLNGGFSGFGGYPSSNSNLLRFSPRKMIRSSSDLSDISMGGGQVSTGGLGGFGTSLRPETRDLMMLPRPRRRTFKQTPVKTLDAPGLTKNFYLNVLEWGPGSKIAVALHNFVYVWDHETSQTYEVAKLGHDSATSVAWMNSNEHLAVGTASGKVMIYDVVTAQRLRTMDGHTRRAGALSWNDYVLSSGSQDATILHRDCRIKDHYIQRLEGHYGEVCGLKWNVELQQLASGGNDNKLKIWSGISNHSSSIVTEPLYEFDEHTSAVKGLAWSPHQRGLLASGGGFCDQKIWFWNTQTGKALSSVSTGSQVCNLVWNPRVKELVSTHGNAYNDIVVWHYPDMTPLTRLRAHGSRALHLSMSPTGDTLVTGAGDETLRLWSMFDDEKNEQSSSVLSNYRQLR